MSICTKCHQTINYRVTVAGKLMPVDPVPVAIITRRGMIVHGWTVHWTTCGQSQRRLPREQRILQSVFSFRDKNGK